jgi:hypothetical protein
MTDIKMTEISYNEKMNEIKTMYADKYDEWHSSYTMSHHPLLYYQLNENLPVLFKMTTEYICKNGNYSRLVDHIVHLYEICKDRGRTLYFSQAFIGTWEKSYRSFENDLMGLSLENKKKVSLAFVIGMLQGRFSKGIIEEPQFPKFYGCTTVEEAYIKVFSTVSNKLSNPAIMLVVSARFAGKQFSVQTDSTALVYESVKKFVTKETTADQIAEELQYLLPGSAPEFNGTPLWWQAVEKKDEGSDA